MNSSKGKIWLLDSNPRLIRDSAFNSLVESIQRDPEFLMARGILIWQVPTTLELAEGDVSPFSGQLGKLVCLGGNQRLKALKALGYKEIPDNWIVEAKDENGNWVSPDKAARMNLLDNSPAGVSGTDDYEVMLKNFNEMTMRMAGIDFSEFMTTMKAETIEKAQDEVSDEVEEGEHGEKSEELKDFISEREKTRNMLKEIDETGFHLLLIFESDEAKVKFIAETGLCGKKGVVSSKLGNYLDLVFECYDQKMEFARQAGLLDEDDNGNPHLLYGMFADGRFIAEKMGINLPESGLHFRNRIVDTQLSEMVREDAPQKSEKQIQEEIFAKLKAERAELGMDTGKEKKKGRKKAKEEEEGGSEEVGYEEVADGEALPSWMAEEQAAAGDGFYVCK